LQGLFLRNFENQELTKFLFQVLQHLSCIICNNFDYFISQGSVAIRLKYGVIL